MTSYANNNIAADMVRKDYFDRLNHAVFVHHCRHCGKYMTYYRHEERRASERHHHRCIFCLEPNTKHVATCDPATVLEAELNGDDHVLKLLRGE